jgi:hypothetical protein
MGFRWNAFAAAGKFGLIIAREAFAHGGGDQFVDAFHDSGGTVGFSGIEDA